MPGLVKTSCTFDVYGDSLDDMNKHARVELRKFGAGESWVFDLEAEAHAVGVDGHVVLWKARVYAHDSALGSRR